MATPNITVDQVVYDFIIIGGGLAGCVVAHRLHEYQPSKKILVVEAGPNVNDRDDITWPNSTNTEGGEFDWKDTTVSQSNLNDRVLPFPLGRALGGGTVINQGGWIRGDSFDYDLWGSVVKDERWSYNGQLPYLKKSERLWSETINPSQHGQSGPMTIQSNTSTKREFPLRSQVLESWSEIGIKPVPGLDGNAGSPLGVVEVQENRENGRRQIAPAKYSLDGVTVLTDTSVAKITIDKSDLRATGIELTDGRQIQGKEVILSAGAVRSPQLLKLSGIGPAEELRSFNIPVVLDHPDVGKNLADHGLFGLGFKVRDPSAGYTIGSPNPLFAKEQYGWGTPADFLVSTDVPKEGLIAAITADEGRPPAPDHPLLANKRTFHEHVLMYVGAPDGSLITIVTFTMLVTARGSISLQSNNVADPPLINPNYLGTAVDRYVAREGVRLQLKLAASDETVLGREILDGEAGAPGFSTTLTTESSDDEIDARIRAAMGTGYHPMGSASMGKVVDTDLRVKGVSGLRVVDASVFPTVITGHLQAAIYALAEQAANIISRTE